LSNLFFLFKFRMKSFIKRFSPESSLTIWLCYTKIGFSILLQYNFENVVKYIYNLSQAFHE